MRYPCLIMSKFCTTPISAELESEDIDMYGNPIEGLTWQGNCNYQDASRVTYTDEKKIVETTGVCLIPGDIAPTLPTISSGVVIVNGEARTIERGIKARNPDGTVNYTRLELI